MPLKRKRRFHRRSRGGCITCKQRHIRCDEVKPCCHNCLKNGVDCGYSGVESSNLSSPSPELVIEEAQQWTASLKGCPPSVSRFDPFNSLRINMSRESNWLFDHYNNYWVLSRTPIRKDPGGEPFELATSDVVLMHLAIILSANHWVRLGGNPSTVESALYYHKVEAIRIINERLRDPARAEQDSTVGAVAAITLAEITCGNPKIATYHLNGLEYLMKLRGDLHTRNLGGLLHRLVLLADTLTSSATRCTPRFYGNLFKGESSRRSSDSTSKSSSDTKYGSLSDSESYISEPIYGMDWDTTKMFRDLQYLSGQVLATNNRTLALDKSKIIDRICTTENHIDSLIHERIERVDVNNHHRDFAFLVLLHGNPIPVRSCAISGSIFIYLFLRRIPILSPVFDWMVGLMQQDFERTEASILATYRPEIIFWMLYIAGLASLGRRQRLWFRGKLARCRMVLKLNCWREAKNILEKLAWAETLGESSGKALWQELDGSALPKLLSPTPNGI